MTQAQTKLVSIIIPALHRPDLTKKCLADLAKQDLRADEWQAIVVENDARPESILPDPLPPNTERITLTENLGTTGSINRGISASSSEYVLILNNDVELRPDYIPLLISALKDGKYAFATGKLLKASDHSVLDGAGDALLRGGSSYRLGHADLDRGQFDQSAELLTACGAATLLRRSVLEEVRGLDESFFAYLDDVDLCLRVHLLGHKGIYVPAAVGYHIGSATLGSLHPKVIEWLTRNQILLLAKDYPAATLIRSIPQIVLSQLLWFAVMARKGLLAYLRGIAGAIGLLPETLKSRKRVMAIRKITNRQFLELLRNSERQVLSWNQDRPQSARSRMLNIYSWFFG